MAFKIGLLFLVISGTAYAELPPHLLENLQAGGQILNAMGIHVPSQAEMMNTYAHQQQMMANLGGGYGGGEGLPGGHHHGFNRNFPRAWHPDYNATLPWTPPIPESSEGREYHQAYLDVVSKPRVNTPYRFSNPSHGIPKLGRPWIPGPEQVKAIKENANFVYYWRTKLDEKCSGKGYQAFQSFGKVIDSMMETLAEGYSPIKKAIPGERQEKTYVLQGAKVRAMYNTAYQFLLEIYDRVEVPDQFAVSANQLLIAMTKLIVLHGGTLPDDPRDPRLKVSLPKIASDAVVKHSKLPEFKEYKPKSQYKGDNGWAADINDAYAFLNHGKQSFCYIPLPEQPKPAAPPPAAPQPQVIPLDKVQIQVVIPAAPAPAPAPATAPANAASPEQAEPLPHASPQPMPEERAVARAGTWRSMVHQ